MGDDFQVLGTNPNGAFTLKAHRGDGMVLLGMDWIDPKPPADFVGFAIEYREPGGQQFLALRNRVTFPTPPSNVGSKPDSTLFAPIQKFRWVHFPFRPELPGAYTYRVRPAFMSSTRKVTLGEAQQVDVELRRETWPGLLNVAYTRGFVSSQAFVDHYDKFGKISTLLPGTAKDGLDFVPTHPKADDALPWMGFEARSAILQVLDEAIADPTAEVRVVAYDLNEPEVMKRLRDLGPRLQIIIDDSGDHGRGDSAETEAATQLEATAGTGHVKRQKMGKLQHNKTIVVEGAAGNVVVCGSTNFSWRGLYVQANNALILRGEQAATVFHEAFEAYRANDTVSGFGKTTSTAWRDLGLGTLDAHVSFSPHLAANARLASVAADIESATSSVFYSLAFLYLTTGDVRQAITHVTEDPKIFVYGMSDRRTGGIKLHSPDGNIQPVRPEALAKDVPLPFSAEPTGGGGARMHHKFVVLDFDLPTARVYTGSYNFSDFADTANGENLVRIRDRRVAVSYMVEALSLFDHYRFRVKQREQPANTPIRLKEPPNAGQQAWWEKDYSVPIRIRDRTLFS